MINMAYCRIRNTLEALVECKRHLDGFDNINDKDDGLSVDEKKALSKLVDICREIADDYQDWR